MNFRKKQSLLEQCHRGIQHGVLLLEAYVQDPERLFFGERRFLNALFAISCEPGHSENLIPGSQVMLIGVLNSPRGLPKVAEKYLDDIGAPKIPETERERSDRINVGSRYDGLSSPDQQARAQQYLRELDQDIERSLKRAQDARRAAALAGKKMPTEPVPPPPPQPTSPALQGGHGPLRDQDIFEDEAVP